MKAFILNGFLLFVISSVLFAQSPSIQWDKTVGGSADDLFRVVRQTFDGGYILGGWSNSNSSGDKTDNLKGDFDYWLIKLDAIGNKTWDKTFGSSFRDELIALQQTSDGGYILGGSSAGNISGDKTENSKGSIDYWVIKLDASGNKVWDKTIGGSNGDQFLALQQTADGGYILGGYSYSDASGDKTENNKGTPIVSSDYWVVKLNASGNKVWDKTIGGSLNDDLYAIQQTMDGGYILGGFSQSNISGDKTEDSKGDYDYWIVKLDGLGNKVWDKTIGGDLGDVLTSLQQTSDGGYILGGRSASGISGDKTENATGGTDYWIVRTDASGNKIWDNTIGGSSGSVLWSVRQTMEGGYIVGGYTTSGAAFDKSENNKGAEDYWIVKLDATGLISWDKTIGGSAEDRFFSLQQTSDGGYILGGYSVSNISGDKTEDSKGSVDYWVIKLNGTGQGCTPGFWKNHVTIWDLSSKTIPSAAGFTTNTYFYQYFSIINSACGLPYDLTMLQATQLGGGNCKKLARHGVPALLNAAAFENNYLQATGYSNFNELKTAISNAFTSGCNCEPLATTLAMANDMLEGPWCGGLTGNSSARTSLITNEIPVEDLNCKIIPNPYHAGAKILFTAIENGNVLIEIFNMTGRKVKVLLNPNVFKGVKYEMQISDDLPSGTYFYRIKNGSIIKSDKFVRM
jgi:hypothetical protein